MILCEKTCKLKRNGKGELLPEKEYLLSFYPNFYNAPTTEAVFNEAEVGVDYNLKLERVQ